MAEIGLLEGFQENLTELQPAKPSETGKSLICGRNVAREFVQLGRCISLRKSSALPLTKLRTAMCSNWTVIVL